MRRTMQFITVLLLLLSFVVSGCSNNIINNNSNANPITTPTVHTSTNSQISSITPTAAQDEKLYVHFINVGQGLSVFVRFPDGKVMLYDAGPSDANLTIIDYLIKNKVKRIDYLVFSHPDADHIGAGADVINSFEVGSIYMPKIPNTTKTFENLLKTIKAKGLNIKEAKFGVKISDISNVDAIFLGPVKYYKDSTNNNSAVLSISYKDFSILLTGDAEQEEENDILGTKLLKNHTILQVGHHGSKYSTGKKFLNVISPKYAVISVGFNKYGHPTNETIGKLESSGAKIYRTDRYGTVTFTYDGINVVVKTEIVNAENISFANY